MIKTLNALAEPNRLKIMEILQNGPRPVGEIVEEMGMHQPQVSKHLRVLVEAGLVEVEKDGQRRIYKVRPQPFRELSAWLEAFQQTWDNRYDRLDELLQKWQTPDQQPD